MIDVLLASSTINRDNGNRKWDIGNTVQYVLC